MCHVFGRYRLARMLFLTTLLVQPSHSPPCSSLAKITQVVQHSTREYILHIPRGKGIVAIARKKRENLEMAAQAQGTNQTSMRGKIIGSKTFDMPTPLPALGQANRFGKEVCLHTILTHSIELKKGR